MAIGSRSIPRCYLLPPGEMVVKGMQAGGEGNHTKSESGSPAGKVAADLQLKTHRLFSKKR